MFSFLKFLNELSISKLPRSNDPRVRQQKRIEALNKKISSSQGSHYDFIHAQSEKNQFLRDIEQKKRIAQQKKQQQMLKQRRP